MEDTMALIKGTTYSDTYFGSRWRDAAATTGCAARAATTTWKAATATTASTAAPTATP
jgi:hypothetical protein